MKNLKTFESLNEEYKGHITARTDFNEEDLRKAFEAGCEVYYDDNDGRHEMNTKENSLVDKEFKKWLKLFFK